MLTVFRDLLGFIERGLGRRAAGWAALILLALLASWILMSVLQQLQTSASRRPAFIPMVRSPAVVECRTAYDADLR